VPNERFQGMSGVGPFGDFVCEIDDLVGQIMDALDRTGQAENTLLLFTSDNGPEDGTLDDEGVYARARRTRHYSMGPLRGIKRDSWEGGHRMPFVARWPAAVPAGSVCGQTVSLADLLVTFAAITGAPLPDGAGEDSVSMLPLLRGDTETPTRDHVLYHSMNGRFSIREGDWVLIGAPPGTITARSRSGSAMSEASSRTTSGGSCSTSGTTRSRRATASPTSPISPHACSRSCAGSRAATRPARRPTPPRRRANRPARPREGRGVGDARPNLL
jgi:arylsulfatase A